MAELAAARALAFDLDGTLVDSLPDLSAAANAMRAHFNLPALAPEQLKLCIGDGIETLTRRALADSPLAADEDICHKALAYFLTYYGQHLTEHTRPYPEVADILALLQKLGLPLAVITNKNAFFASQILRQLKLFNYFSLIIGGDSLPEKKPAALPLLHVADVFNIATGQLIMIGDSVNDLKAAAAAKTLAIGVTYGYEPRLAAKCRQQHLEYLFLVSSFSELYPPLRQLKFS